MTDRIKKRGRPRMDPSKLAEARRQISAGYAVSTAALLAGISETTLWRYLREEDPKRWAKWRTARKALNDPRVLAKALAWYRAADERSLQDTCRKFPSITHERLRLTAIAAGVSKVQWQRPRVIDLDKVKALRLEGRSWRAIGVVLNCEESAVRRAVRHAIWEGRLPLSWPN